MPGKGMHQQHQSLGLAAAPVGPSAQTGPPHAASFHCLIPLATKPFNETQNLGEETAQGGMGTLSDG